MDQCEEKELKRRQEEAEDDMFEEQEEESDEDFMDEDEEMSANRAINDERYKNLLRKEFVSSLRNSFISGQDETFDYK